MRVRAGLKRENWVSHHIPSVPIHTFRWIILLTEYICKRLIVGENNPYMVFSLNTYKSSWSLQMKHMKNLLVLIGALSVAGTAWAEEATTDEMTGHKDRVSKYKGFVDRGFASSLGNSLVKRVGLTDEQLVTLELKLTEIQDSMPTGDATREELLEARVAAHMAVQAALDEILTDEQKEQLKVKTYGNKYGKQKELTEEQKAERAAKKAEWEAKKAERKAEMEAKKAEYDSLTDEEKAAKKAERKEAMEAKKEASEGTKSFSKKGMRPAKGQKMEHS